MSEARQLTVTAEDDGQRLDRWLKKRVPEIPYALIQKLIRKGAIKIDGKKAKTDSRLSEGQQIRLPTYEDRGPTPKAPRPPTSRCSPPTPRPLSPPSSATPPNDPPALRRFPIYPRVAPHRPNLPR